MNKCPWCGGETESGHTEVSGIGSGCHTLDIWYTVCASDNFCGYYSVSDDPENGGVCTCKFPVFPNKDTLYICGNCGQPRRR